MLSYVAGTVKIRCFRMNTTDRMVIVGRTSHQISDVFGIGPGSIRVSLIVRFQSARVKTADFRVSNKQAMHIGVSSLGRLGLPSPRDHFATDSADLQAWRRSVRPPLHPLKAILMSSCTRPNWPEAQSAPNATRLLLGSLWEPKHHDCVFTLCVVRRIVIARCYSDELFASRFICDDAAVDRTNAQVALQEESAGLGIEG